MKKMAVAEVNESTQGLEPFSTLDDPIEEGELSDTGEILQDETIHLDPGKEFASTAGDSKLEPSTSTQRKPGGLVASDRPFINTTTTNAGKPPQPRTLQSTGFERNDTGSLGHAVHTGAKTNAPNNERTDTNVEVHPTRTSGRTSVQTKHFATEHSQHYQPKMSQGTQPPKRNRDDSIDSRDDDFDDFYGEYASEYDSVDYDTRERSPENVIHPGENSPYRDNMFGCVFVNRYIGGARGRLEIPGRGSQPELDKVRERYRGYYNLGFNEARREEYNTLGQTLLDIVRSPMQGATGPLAQIPIYQRCATSRPADEGATLKDFSGMQGKLLSGEWTYESVYEHSLAMLSWIEKGELDPYREIRGFSKELVNDKFNQTGFLGFRGATRDFVCPRNKSTDDDTHWGNIILLQQVTLAYNLLTGISHNMMCVDTLLNPFEWRQFETRTREIHDFRGMRPTTAHLFPDQYVGGLRLFATLYEVLRIRATRPGNSASTVINGAELRYIYAMSGSIAQRLDRKFPGTQLLKENTHWVSMRDFQGDWKGSYYQNAFIPPEVAKARYAQGSGVQLPDQYTSSGALGPMWGLSTGVRKGQQHLCFLKSIVVNRDGIERPVHADNFVGHSEDGRVEILQMPFPIFTSEQDNTQSPLPVYNLCDIVRGDPCYETHHLEATAKSMGYPHGFPTEDPHELNHDFLAAPHPPGASGRAPLGGMRRAMNPPPPGGATTSGPLDGEALRAAHLSRDSSFIAASGGGQKSSEPSARFETFRKIQTHPAYEEWEMARQFNATLPPRFRNPDSAEIADHWFVTKEQAKRPEYAFASYSKGEILEDTSAEGRRLQEQLDAAKRVASPIHRRQWDSGELTLVMALENRLAKCERANDEDRAQGIYPRRLADAEKLTLEILTIEWTNHLHALPADSPPASPLPAAKTHASRGQQEHSKGSMPTWGTSRQPTATHNPMSSFPPSSGFPAAHLTFGLPQGGHHLPPGHQGTPFTPMSGSATSSAPYPRPLYGATPTPSAASNMTLFMQPSAIDLRRVPQFSVTAVKEFVEAVDHVVATNMGVTVPYHAKMDEDARKRVALLFQETRIVPYPYADATGAPLNEQTWREEWWEYPEMTWALVSKALRERYIDSKDKQCTDVQAFSSLDTLRKHIKPIGFEIPTKRDSVDDLTIQLTDYELMFRAGITPLSPSGGSRNIHERLYQRLISFLVSRALPLQPNGIRIKDHPISTYTQRFAQAWAEAMEDNIPEYLSWGHFKEQAKTALTGLSATFMTMMHLTPEATAMGFFPTATKGTEPIPALTFAQALRINPLPQHTQRGCSTCGSTVGIHDPCPNLHHPYANHDGGAFADSRTGRKMAENAVLMTRIEGGRRVLTISKKSGDFVPMEYIHRDHSGDRDPVKAPVTLQNGSLGYWPIIIDSGTGATGLVRSSTTPAPHSTQYHQHHGETCVPCCVTCGVTQRPPTNTIPLLATHSLRRAPNETVTIRCLLSQGHATVVGDHNIPHPVTMAGIEVSATRDTDLPGMYGHGHTTSHDTQRRRICRTVGGWRKMSTQNSKICGQPSHEDKTEQSSKQRGASGLLSQHLLATTAPPAPTTIRVAPQHASPLPQDPQQHEEVPSVSIVTAAEATTASTKGATAIIGQGNGATTTIVHNHASRRSTKRSRRMKPAPVAEPQGSSGNNATLIFLDTGALESNYIRRDIINKFGLEVVSDSLTHICGVFGDCSTSTHTCFIRLRILSHPGSSKTQQRCFPKSVVSASRATQDDSNVNLPHDLSTITLLLRCRVLDDMPYEVIIGRPAILKHHLWERVYAPRAVDDMSSGLTSRLFNEEHVPYTLNAINAPMITPRLHERTPLQLDSLCCDPGQRSHLLVTTDLHTSVRALAPALSGKRVRHVSFAQSVTVCPLGLRRGEARFESARKGSGTNAGTSQSLFTPHVPLASQPVRSILRTPTALSKDARDGESSRTPGPDRLGAMYTHENTIESTPSRGASVFDKSPTKFVRGVDRPETIPQIKIVGYVHTTPQTDIRSTGKAKGMSLWSQSWAQAHCVGDGGVPVLTRSQMLSLLRVRATLQRTPHSRARERLSKRKSLGKQASEGDSEARRPVPRLTRFRPDMSRMDSCLARGHEALESLHLWSSDWFLGKLGAPLSLEDQRRRVLATIQQLLRAHNDALTCRGDPPLSEEDLQTTEPLHMLRDLTEDDILTMTTSSSLNRTPLSDLIHHEEEAQGLEVLGTEAPEYTLSPSTSPGGDEIESTSYIPPDIQGEEVLLNDRTTTLQSALQATCTEFVKVFNTRLLAEPAKITPMELTVDDSKWKTRANKGAVRPQSIDKQEEVVSQTKELRSLKVISPSQAEFYSQVHLTPKPHLKPGEPIKWRFCIDYRRLNEATETIGGPIPNIKEMLHRLGARKAKFFCKLDLTSGYHQAPLHPNSRKYTAFRTFGGLFEWDRVPMGLKGAPSFFQQKLETEVLHDMLYDICELYIDDIVIYASTPDQMVKNLKRVLARLSEKGITVSPKKCSFGVKEVEFLGHTINADGVHFSREKLDHVLNIPPPSTAKQLKSFLGVTVFFHDHVLNYSDMVRPLHRMLSSYQPRKILRWTDNTRDAFERVKAAVNACPQLYFIDDTSPIFVNTDASDYGIGAMCYQVVTDPVTARERIHPVAFMSRALTPTETNWTVTEKECFAIVYAFRKYEHLLMGRKFTLFTDHKNLIYIDSETSQKVKRWKLAIQIFDCDVAHIAGPKNIVADGFSRFVVPTMGTPTHEELHWVWEQHFIAPETTKSLPVLKVVEKSVESLGFVKPVRFLPEFDQVIRRFHNTDVGHLGAERTYRKMLQEGVPPFPQMREHVKHFIKCCPCCQKMNMLRNSIATARYTTATFEPMERINIDTIGPLPESHNGSKYILAIIDCFTRWITIYPLKDLTMEAAAVQLSWHFGHWGTPRQVLHDAGTQFENKEVLALIALCGAWNTTTIAYSKEDNSLIERSNKEIMRHLRNIVTEKTVALDWERHLGTVMRIMNTQKRIFGHKEAEFPSPAELVFGRTITLDRQLFVAPEEFHAHGEAELSIRHWADRMLKTQNIILEEAIREQHRRDEAFLAKPVTGKHTISFRKGAYVLLDYPTMEARVSHRGPPNKFLPFLKGPFKVMTKDMDIYGVQCLITDSLDQVHVSRLRPFITTHTGVDDDKIRKIAMWDYLHDYPVDHVVDHDGEPTARRKLLFRIRWKTFGPERDSWIPYAALRENEFLHTYLLRLGTTAWTSLIPQQFHEQYNLVRSPGRRGKKPRNETPNTNTTSL